MVGRSEVKIGEILGHSWLWEEDDEEVLEVLFGVEVVFLEQLRGQIDAADCTTILCGADDVANFVE